MVCTYVKFNNERWQIEGDRPSQEIQGDLPDFVICAEILTFMVIDPGQRFILTHNQLARSETILETCLQDVDVTDMDTVGTVAALKPGETALVPTTITWNLPKCR